MSKRFASGQIFVRAKGDTPLEDDDDRQLFIVLGVVAVPKSSGWKDEHMIPVVSFDDGETLHVEVDNQMDFEERIPRGYRADQILTGKFWRV
jgi:hypothetical protein